MSIRKTHIPPVDHLPEEIASILRPMKMLLEQVDQDLTTETNRADGLAQDLKKSGIPSGTIYPGYIPPIPGYEPPEPDYSEPDVFTNLTAEAAMKSILLQWDNPTGDPLYAYAEIWRAIKALPTDPDPVIGDAIKIGTTTSWLYSDYLGDYGVHAFYWIRPVSIWDVIGSWNAASGTDATTATINGIDMSDGIITAAKIQANTVTDNEMVSIDWSKILTRPEDTALLNAYQTWADIQSRPTDSELLNVNQNWSDVQDDGGKPDNNADVTGSNTALNVVGQTGFATLSQITAANIATYVGLLAVDTAYINDLAITQAKIGDAAIGTAQIQNAAITNALINDLSADKINAGTLAAARIATGSLSGDKITAATLNGDRIVAGSIAADRLVANSIGAGQIAANAITAAGGEIADLTVTTLKIQNNAVTVGNGYSDASENGVNNGSMEAMAWVGQNGQGQPLYVTFTVRVRASSFTSTGSSTRNLLARIRRWDGTNSVYIWGGSGGVNVASRKSSDSNPSDPYDECLTFAVRNAPGAGWYTYYLELHSPQAGSFYYCSQRAAFIIGLKK